MKIPQKGDVTKIIKTFDDFPQSGSMQQKLNFIKQNYENIIKLTLDINDIQKLSKEQIKDRELLSLVDRRDQEINQNCVPAVEFSKFCHNNEKTNSDKKKEYPDLHRSSKFIVVNVKGEICVNKDLNAVYNKHVKAGQEYKDAVIETLFNEKELMQINIQDFLKYLVNNKHETEFSKVWEVKLKYNTNDLDHLQGEFISISQIEEVFFNSLKNGEKNDLNDLIFVKYLKFRGFQLDKGIKNMEEAVRKKSNSDLRIIEDKSKF